MLTLPIKKKWYDMILSGEKKEEYREITPYYEKRFRNLGMLLDDNDGYDGWYGELRLRNGYHANAPTIQILAFLFVGPGKTEWGAEPGKNYYVLDIIKVKEVKKRDKRG